MRDLIIGLLFVSPVFALGVVTYNPPEREALARDDSKKDTISIVARALEPHFKQVGVFPKDLSVLEFTPPEIEKYIYKVSEDGKKIIIYRQAESLAWRERCFAGTPFILYSSVENRTEIVCTNSPAPGEQEFVN